MSNYTVFARKYRPQVFVDVLGQEHITRTLRNAIDQNRIAHAYIFVGPRGTGKTSTARIFAKALNCTGGPKADFDPEDDICQEIMQGRSLDVIEIDGASNNGVEQVRELRENVQFAPARGRYKIYIIDEVHMLSTAAFNALLKTLEEPPAHAKFLLATTDVQKVLPTILSRCQRFDLRRIPTATIASHLQFIAGKEGFILDPAAADAVARGAEGGLRDAESMLDQLVAFCGDQITEQDVLNVFGFTGVQVVAGLCEAILRADAPAALGAIHEQAEAGKDLSRLLSDLIMHLRNLLVIKADRSTLEAELSPEALGLVDAQAGLVSSEKLLDLIEQLAGAESRMKWVPNKKMHFEVAAIRAIQILQTATLTEVLDTLTELRGGPAAPTMAAKPVSPAAKTDSPAGKTDSPPAKAVASPRPPVIAPKSEPVPKPEAPKSVVEPAPEPKPMPVAAAAPPVPTPPVPEPPAAEPPAAEPPKPPAAQDDPPISKLWETLVQTVRKNRPLVSNWLENAMLVANEGNVCVLALAPDQNITKEFLERDHLTFLQETISDILGRPIKIRLELREGVVPVSIPKPEPEKPKDPAEDFKNDPLIKKALEIFKADIQTV